MVDRQRIDAARWRTYVRSEYRGTVQHVALLLSTYMDADGGGAFPSITTIVQEAGRSRETVVASLRSLDDDGFIRKTPNRGMRGGQRGPRTTLYEATIPARLVSNTGTSPRTSFRREAIPLDRRTGSMT